MAAASATRQPSCSTRRTEGPDHDGSCGASSCTFIRGFLVGARGLGNRGPTSRPWMNNRDIVHILEAASVQRSRERNAASLTRARRCAESSVRVATAHGLDVAEAALDQVARGGGGGRRRRAGASGSASAARPSATAGAGLAQGVAVIDAAGDQDDRARRLQRDRPPSVRRAPVLASASARQDGPRHRRGPGSWGARRASVPSRRRRPPRAVGAMPMDAHRRAVDELEASVVRLGEFGSVRATAQGVSQVMGRPRRSAPSAHGVPVRSRRTIPDSPVRSSTRGMPHVGRKRRLDQRPLRLRRSFGHDLASPIHFRLIRRVR